MRVLIVEDEKSNSKRLKTLIQKIDAGFIVEAVSESIEDTVNWLNNNDNPDLIKQ